MCYSQEKNSTLIIPLCKDYIKYEGSKQYSCKMYMGIKDIW